MAQVVLQRRSSYSVSGNSYLMKTLLFQLGSPVHDDADRCKICLLEICVDEKALSIGCDRVVISEACKNQNTRLEEWFGNTCFECGSQPHIHCHEFSIGGKVEKLLSISSPFWLGTTIGRYPPLATRGRECLNIDLRTPRFIRSIGNPFSVRRELGLLFVEGCLQERNWLPLSCHRQ